jgi:hypothetical protein
VSLSRLEARELRGYGSASIADDEGMPMAGDTELNHDVQPHQQSYDGFMRMVKMGTIAVFVIIVPLVIFIITR